jgi:hypothetical protein
MVDSINRARDEWISNFKQSWDNHVGQLVIKRTEGLKKVLIEHDVRMDKLAKEYAEKKHSLMVTLQHEQKAVEDNHRLELDAFLNSHIEKTSLYQTICSYIVSIRDRLSIGDHSSATRPHEAQVNTPMYNDYEEISYDSIYDGPAPRYEQPTGPECYRVGKYELP